MHIKKALQQIVIKLIFSPDAPWDRSGLQHTKSNCMRDNKLHNHNYFTNKPKKIKSVFGTLLFMENSMVINI